MRKVVFPHSGIQVGGSIISASLIIDHLNHSPHWEAEAIYPGEGPASELYREMNLKTSIVPIHENSIRNIHHSAGWKGKLRALKAYRESYVSARKYLQEKRPDLVHLNDDTSILTWGVAAKKQGIPVIWHIRQEKGNHVLDTIRLRYANYLIYIAKNTSFRFEQQAAKPASRIIYNGVNLSTYWHPAVKREVKERLGLHPDRLLVGFVGNLKKAKRPEWFIAACIQGLEEGLDFDAIVIGEDYEGGAYRKQLQAQIEESGFGSRIKLQGYEAHPEEWMRAMDVFGLTSVSEPFGRVVIEAMASGAAVVATAAGGVPEILTDQEDGLLSDTNDPVHFYHQLKTLIQNASLRDQLAGKALATVHRRFSAEETSRQIQSVYDELLYEPILYRIGDAPR